MNQKTINFEVITCIQTFNLYILESNNNLPKELQLLNTSLFKSLKLEIKSCIPDKESKAYTAFSIQLNSLNTIFRTAKITPKKIGQFVTIWKRNAFGITAPFSVTDPIDFFLIYTEEEGKSGLFIFPKMVLFHHKIVADATRDGKRGIRVYPSWVIPTNKQALKSQEWQTKYFLNLSPDQTIDLKIAAQLFESK